MTGPAAQAGGHSHSQLIVLDAGPVLNFMGRKDTTALYLNGLKAMTDEIIIPDAVAEEINAKSRTDKRFALCQTQLAKVIGGHHITLLETPDVDSVSDFTIHWTWLRLNAPKDMSLTGKHRGEMVLVAHGRTLLAQGKDVVAMIDDQDAILLAEKAGIDTFTTIEFFQECVRRGYIEDKAQLKKLYGYVCFQDDGLLPFGKTELIHEF